MFAPSNSLKYLESDHKILDTYSNRGLTYGSSTTYKYCINEGITATPVNFIWVVYLFANIEHLMNQTHGRLIKVSLNGFDAS